MKVDFKTSKGNFTFVKLPNGATNPTKGLFPPCLWYRDCFGYHITDFDIPLKENDKMLGFVKDLTEEDWSQIVDLDEFNSIMDSVKDLMSKLDIYLVNPISYPEVYYDPEISKDSVHNGFYDENWMNEYQKFEELTGNWILIKYFKDEI